MSSQVTAQNEDFLYSWYTQDDGLPDREIQKIIKDDLGFLWMLGKSIYKYDGKRYSIYNSSDESSCRLTIGSPEQILLSPDNHIWIRDDKKINVIDPISNKLIWESSPDYVVQKMYVYNNQVWIKTFDNSTSNLLKIDSGFNSESFSTFFSSQVVGDIIVDSLEKNLWYINLQSHIIHVDLVHRITTTLDSITFPQFNSSHTIGLELDGDDKLWVVKYFGSRVKPMFWDTLNNKLSPLKFKSKFLNYCGKEDKNRWWFFNSQCNCVQLINIKTHNIEFSSSSKFKSKFYSVFKIDDDVNWALSSYGILKIKRNTENRFSTYLQDIYGDGPSASMRNLLELPCSNYLLTSDNGSSILSNDLKTIQKLRIQGNLEGRLDQKYTSLYDKENQMLWMGDEHNSMTALPIENGTLKQNVKLKRYHGGSKGIVQLSKDRLLVGGEDNLKYFNIKTRQFSPPLAVYDNLLIKKLFMKSDSSIWMISNRGLFLIDNKGDIRQEISMSTSPLQLASNDLNDIIEDHFGNFWIASMRGLDYIDFSSTFVSHYDTHDGLPDNRIGSILEDFDGNIWLGTYDGLSKYDPKAKKFYNFFKADGISDNEFNRYSKLKTSDGKFMFGTINGVTCFSPEEFHSSHDNDANFLLTGITTFEDGGSQLMRHPIQADQIQTLKIKPTNKYFRFDFALLDFHNTDQHRYKWKLDGYDQDWQGPSQNPYVQYNNIPHGIYTFKAKGAASDGNWSDMEILVPITVGQFFYKAWWFIGLLILGIGSVIYLLHRKSIEKAIAVERLRTRIASDLHDEIGSKMTKISINSDMINSGLYTEEEQNKILEKIASQSREVVSGMSDMVWSIDARNDSFYDLIDRMREHCSDMFSDADISYTFQFNKDDWPTSNKKISIAFRQNLYLIFKEAINNIVKHSDANQVDITIKNTDQQFELEISDNGSQQNNLHTTGQGISNMKMRAKRVNGKMTIDRSEGFSIRLSVPIANI